jgi:hypothetical protein
MTSTLLELAGFGSLVESANLLLGRGAAFLVAGLALLLVGTAVDDAGVASTVRKLAAQPRIGYLRAKASLVARRQRRADREKNKPAVRVRLEQ